MIKQRVVQNESLRGHWSGHNLVPDIPSSPGMSAQYRLYLRIPHGVCFDHEETMRGEPVKEEFRKAQKRRIIRVGMVLKAFLERESASTTLLSKLFGVDAQWANYFKRRWIMPLQEIIEERDDGSLIVRFIACSDEEISMCMKPWLPHVRVLRPKDVRNRLVKEYKQWIQWQESNKGVYE